MKSKRKGGGHRSGNPPTNRVLKRLRQGVYKEDKKK